MTIAERAFVSLAHVILRGGRRAVAIVGLVVGLSVVTAIHGPFASDPPCDLDPTPFTCATYPNRPTNCDDPSVEFLGTSEGDDNFFIDLSGDEWLYVYAKVHSQCGTCNTAIAAGGIFGLEFDGGAGGSIGLQIISNSRSGDLIVSKVRKSDLLFNLLLRCKHTARMVVDVREVGGDCSVNPGHVRKESRSFTVWLDYPYTSWPEDMAYCTGPAPSCQRTVNGQPVDVVSGDMFHEMQDLRIQGPQPVEFSRHYESGFATFNLDGPMGVGWQHSYMVRLVDLGQAQVKTLIESDLRRVRFNCLMGTPETCSGPWAPDSIAHLSLEQGTNPPWRVTDKNKTQRDFDAEGRLIAIRDRNGNSMTLIYEGTPAKLTYIRDTFNRELALEYYDSAGTRLKKILGGGRTIEYEYDGDGNLWKVWRSDAIAQDVLFVTYEYWPNHLLKKATDANGHVIEEHTYENGRVSESHSHGGNNGFTVTYNDATSQSTVTNTRNIPTTFTNDRHRGIALDRLGGPGCNSCGGSGDETQKLYDDYLNVTDVIDGNDVRTHMTYDAQGNVLTRTENCIWQTDHCADDPFNPADPDDPFSRVTTYIYDDDDNPNLPTTISSPSTGDCVNQAKRIINTYSAKGNLKVAETSGCNDHVPFAYATTYEYFDTVEDIAAGMRGQLKSVNGPRDDANDVLDKTTYSYYDNDAAVNNRGRLKEELRNGFPQPTKFSEYDLFGNVGKVTDPNGVETTYLYNSRDQVLTKRIRTTPNVDSPDDFVTRYEYDGFGNLHRVLLPKCVGGCQFSLEYEYDVVNRLKEVRDRVGNKIVYTYDTEGNRVREEYRDASTSVERFTNFAYDDFNRLQYTYFSNSPLPPASGSIFYRNKYYTDGTREAERDPLGHVKTFTYDSFKRLATVTETVGAETLTTAYEYDAQDNLTKVTDPRGLETTYVYGDLGWRLASFSPDTGHSGFTYDPAGNLLTSTDENHITVTHAYDELDRLKSTTYPGTSLNVTISYDAGPFGIGHRTEQTDASGTTYYAYDRRGLLLSELKVLKGSEWSYETSYDYDENGNLREIRYPASNTTARQGRVIYDYDIADRVNAVSAEVNGQTVPIAHDIQYKPFGPRSQLAYGNDLIDARSYDTRYQLGVWTLGNSALGNLLNYTHGFDNDGNLTSRLDNVSHTNDRSFAYDEVHRLTSALSPLWPSGNNLCGGTYTYDKNGNRLCGLDMGTAFDYTYAAGTNHLASTSNGVSTVFYSYDPTGNTSDDDTHTYQHTEAGRLGTVDEGGTATYKYDGDGRRVKKTSAAGETYYFYDSAGRLLTEMFLDDFSGRGVGKDYVYLHGAPIGRVDWSVIDNLDACPPGLGTSEGECDPQVANAELFYYHTDHLDTPIAMTAGDASVVWRAEHLPFGEAIIDPSATISNNLRFPGQYFDSETGLHQNWFRDYDPKTGRYREADPIGQAGGLNVYSYVEEDPLNGIDPSGRKKIYGFWCGGSWTGGYGKPWNELTPIEQSAALPPSDALDAACKEHDLCYADCRKDWPCNAGMRGVCFRICDLHLENKAYNIGGFWGRLVGEGIEHKPMDSEADSSSCCSGAKN